MGSFKYAYNKETEQAGVYMHVGDKVFFSPAKPYRTLYKGDRVSVMEVAINVLLLTEQLIPLLIRLWLMLFGNKEQKETAQLHHKAAKAIREAKREIEL